MNQTIPTHLIAGALGVGKTTAIIDYLRRHADDQFVAVLVNDFGPVGIDGAVIEADGKPRTKVMMVPGGCICCSAAAGFAGALEEIGKLPRRPDRIIIEPSGLAMLGDMVDLLESAAEHNHLEIRPVVTLLDPKVLKRPAFTRMPYFVRMVEASDVLVANRCDLAWEEEIRQFQEWAASLYPPKLSVITTRQGQIPDEVFDLRADAATVPAQSFGFTLEQEQSREFVRLSPTPAAANHAADHQAGGLSWESGTVFHFANVEAALQELAQEGLNGAVLARLKGILHTDQGWQLVEIACGQVHARSTDYRRDNRLDWIAQGSHLSAERIREIFDRITVPR